MFLGRTSPITCRSTPRLSTGQSVTLGVNGESSVTDMPKAYKVIINGKAVEAESSFSAHPFGHYPHDRADK